MQRRSFLGALASLPLLAGFKSQVMKDEAEQSKRDSEIKFNDIDGATQRLLDYKLNHCSGSGTFTHLDWNLTYGSGTIPRCSG